VEESGKWVAAHVAFVSREERSSQVTADSASTSTNSYSSADASPYQAAPLIPYLPTAAAAPFHHSSYLPPGMGYPYPPPQPVPPPYEQTGFGGGHSNPQAWMMAPPPSAVPFNNGRLTMANNSGAATGTDSADSADSAAATAENGTMQATFLPSAAWAGAVAGYVFRSGAQGQGYYLEGGGGSSATTPTAGSAAAAAAGSSASGQSSEPATASAPDAAASVDCGAALQKVSKALSGNKVNSAAPVPLKR